MRKNLDEALWFLGYVAKVSKRWEDLVIKEQLRDKGVNERVSGVCTLLNGLDFEVYHHTPRLASKA